MKLEILQKKIHAMSWSRFDATTHLLLQCYGLVRLKEKTRNLNEFDKKTFCYKKTVGGDILNDKQCCGNGLVLWGPRPFEPYQASFWPSSGDVMMVLETDGSSDMGRRPVVGKLFD